jgi:hypothetical protein
MFIFIGINKNVINNIQIGQQNSFTNELSSPGQL